MSVYPGIDDKRVIRVPGQKGPGYRVTYPSSGITIPAGVMPLGEEATLYFVWKDNGTPNLGVGDFYYDLLVDTVKYSGTCRWHSYSDGLRVWCGLWDGSTSYDFWMYDITPATINYLIFRWSASRGLAEIECNGKKQQYTLDFTPVYSGGSYSLFNSRIGQDRTFLDFKAFSYWEDNPQGKDGDLFTLGKKVGSTIFDTINPTVLGTASRNVQAVIRDAVWALELDGSSPGGTAPIEVQLSSPNLFENYVMFFLSFTPYMLLNYNYLLESSGSFFPVNVATYAPPHSLRLTLYRVGIEVDNVVRVGESITVVSQAAYNEQEYDIYINGVLKKSSSSAAFDPDWRITDKLLIGGVWHKWIGLIYLPVILYARDLPESEVSLMAQRRFSEVSQEGLVLYVDYDPNTSQLVDRSPYNHQLSMVGGIRVKKVML